MIRILTWGSILLVFVLGVVFFLDRGGEAAETINASKVGVMSSDDLGLVGHWTLDGNDIVWADANEIKDTNPGTKHDGNVAGSLAAGSAVRGQTGQGLLFNGSSDSISLGNVYNGVKTVSFWAKPNSTTQPFIDLNGTATVDVDAGTVRGNNFSTPTVYVDGVAMTGTSPAAPTFVSEYPTAFNSATSPKTAMNAVSINNGDVLIGVAAHENESGTLAITENGATSWVSQQTDKTTDYSETSAWSYVATTDETLTVTFTDNTDYFGGNVVRFSGSDGVGASAKNQGASGSPSVNITTTQADSAIVVIVSDWNATGGTQTFTSDGGAGSPTNLTDYPGDSSHYGVAIAYYPNAGVVGSKTVGMSVPTGQKWTIIAVEVKGIAGDTPLDTDWHHIAVTTGTGINASAAYLGKIASSYLGGMLDDIRFYSSELSATQVADLYQAVASKQVVSYGGDDMMTNGLVGYWTFDGDDVVWGDTGTEIKDVSGNSNHGAVSGLTRSSVTRGKLGQGLSFNGTSDYVDTTNISSTQQTICAWYNWRSYPSGVDPDWTDALLYKGNEDVDGFFGLCPLYAVARSITSGKVFAVYDEDADLGEWNFVCGVLDGAGSLLHFYFNGILGSTTSIIGFSPNSAIWSIGRDSYHNRFYFDGSIDDVRIYDRALSTAEITNLYNIGR